MATTEAHQVGGASAYARKNATPASALRSRLGSGLPHVSERSLRQRGNPTAGRRITASADRDACVAFFDLAQRAVRIAPPTWCASVAACGDRVALPSCAEQTITSTPRGIRAKQHLSTPAACVSFFDLAERAASRRPPGAPPSLPAPIESLFLRA